MSTPTILSAINQIRSLLTRKEKLQWGGMVGFAVCSSSLEVLTASIIVFFAQILTNPELAKTYISKFKSTQHLTSANAVVYVALFCGVVYLIKNLIAAVEVFYQNFMIQKMNFQFKNKFLYNYAEMSYVSYLRRNSSEGLSVVEGDIERLFSTGMVAFANIISESIIFVFLIAMIIYMNPSLAALIFIIGGILVWIIWKNMLPFFYKLGQNFQKSAHLRNQFLLQFFHAFKEVVLLEKQQAFITAYQQYSAHASRIFAIQTSVNAIPRLVIETLFVSLFVIAVSYMVFEHDSPQRMMGILGGYLYVGFRLMPGLNRIIGQLNNFKSIIPSIQKVHHEYSSKIDKEKYLDITDFRFNKSIAINNVCFTYSCSDREILKEISLTIKKGEKIGIIGETGSGKSTLIDLILGLLKPAIGEIIIDNQYLAQCRQWHRMIGYVPQSIYLVDDTIEANIAFGESKVDKHRLNQAIVDAQLNRFIEKLSEGSQTIVGERGIRLSGGERQRISIARALYRDPEVLIFDEATSALDSETETNLMDTINEVSKNRTVIMVAHRLTTLKDCDRIVMMRDGKIHNIATYSNLIENRTIPTYDNLGAI